MISFVSLTGDGMPPRHPTTDGRVPLIVRLGLHDDRVLREFDGFGMPIVAQTILQNEAHRRLAQLARDQHGLAVLIDPENFLNQCEPRLRRRSFQEARYATRVIFDPRFDQLDSSSEVAYARETLAEQRERRATLLLTPYHVVGGRTCQGRAIDLRLAELSVRLFHSMQWSASTPGERFPLERELYAGIAIQATDLGDASDRRWLQQAYSSLGVSGFFVRIAGFDEHSPQLVAERCTEFLLGLWRLSERPVVLGGGGNVWMALLAEGLPAVSIGIGEGERFTFPPQPQGSRQGRPVYHEGLMRSVNPKSPSQEAAARAHRLFREFQCDCGHHPRHRVPKGPECKLHTFSLRYRDARAFSAGSLDERQRLLSVRLSRARAIALELGYPQPGVAWQAVASAAERLRASGLRSGAND